MISHWKNIGKKVGAETLISRPNFKNCAIFSESLVAVQMKKLKVKYDKPIYIGFSISEISKLIMYDFFYGVIKKQYGDNAQLLYSDTDSVILEFFTKYI